MEIKNKLYFLLLLFSINVLSQQLSDSEINKLKSLEVDVSNISFDTSKVNSDLKQLLRKDTARKSNKTTAIVLSSISVLTIAGGILAIENDNSDGYQSIGGVMLVSTGLISGGVSLPFWFYTEKRKRERNQLIKLYKNE